MDYVYKGYTEEQIFQIKSELKKIADNYIPVMPYDSRKANLLYITQTYNDNHPDDILNGEDVLSIFIIADKPVEAGVK